MILSNHALLQAMKKGWFAIENLPITLDQLDPSRAPFNTSAIDLHLGEELAIPSQAGSSPITIDFMSGGGIARLLEKTSDHKVITADQPYKLNHGQFLLAKTRERVDFRPRTEVAFGDYPSVSSLAARVEGKSSLARCGILVHFTAPTIHAGFFGTITLEMMNLGPWPILLTPGMPICQLIVETVLGVVVDAPNQFAGQSRAAGAEGKSK